MVKNVNKLAIDSLKKYSLHYKKYLNKKSKIKYLGNMKDFTIEKKIKILKKTKKLLTRYHHDYNNRWEIYP